MANSRKYSNYYIINEDVLKSGLKGNELLVYALIYAYCSAGHQFNCTIKNIMERTNIDRKPTVIEILQRLVSKGYLVKVGQEKVGITSCVYELGGSENVPQRGTETEPVRKPNQYGKSTTTGTESEPVRYGKSTTTGTESEPPYNNEDNIVDNIKDNIVDNKECVSSAREGENLEEKKVVGDEVWPTGSIQAREQREKDIKIGIMLGWRSHFEATFGKEYFLRGSLTQEVSDLAPAIEQLMESEGKPTTQGSVAEYTCALFNRMHTTANKWQLENWNLRVITKQFNELLNNGKYQSESGSKGERPRQIADASQFVDRL